MVTIRNKRTGEIRQVARSQAANLTPSTPAAAPAQGGGIADWLPLAGGIAGSFIPGLGTIVGGALGAGAGTLLKQGIKGQGDPGEVIKEAALSGAGGLAGRGIGALASRFLPKAASGAGKLGEDLIASQYNVPRNAATRINFPESIRSLTKYGITEMDRIPQIADTVTGADGIISKATRAAVAGAKRVNLGATQTRGSLLDLAQDVAADPSLPVGQDQKFVEFVKKGIQSMMGARQGTIMPDADPSEVFGFIQKLEKQAASIGGGKARTLLSDSEAALKRSYRLLADDLRERLFVEGGADTALVTAITPEQLTQLAKISPQLAREVANARTVGELRGIAAPFVQANQAADLTEAASRFGLSDVSGRGKGLGRLLPSLTDPLAPFRALLSSGPVNAAAGKAAMGAGGKIPGSLPTPAMERIGVGAGASMGGVGGQEAVEGELIGQEDPTVNLASSGQPGGNQEELLRQAFFLAMLQNPKNASTLKTIYEFGFPKSKVTANQEKGLNKVADASSIAKQIETEFKKVGSTGRVSGLVQKGTSAIGINPQTTAYEALRQASIGPLARAISAEVGVLTDKDIARAEALLPRVTDTPEEARLKLQNLKQAIADRRKNIKSSPTSSDSSLPLPSDLGI